MCEPSKVMADVLVSFLGALSPPFLFLFESQFIFLASHHPHIPTFLPDTYCAFFELFGDTHENHSVVNETGLDVPVERSVSGKGRRVVNLKKNRLEVVCDNDVET